MDRFGCCAENGSLEKNGKNGKKKKVWLAVFALVHLEGGPEDVGWGISGGDGED